MFSKKNVSCCFQFVGSASFSRTSNKALIVFRIESYFSQPGKSWQLDEVLQQYTKTRIEDFSKITSLGLTEKLTMVVF